MVSIFQKRSNLKDDRLLSDKSCMVWLGLCMVQASHTPQTIQLLFHSRREVVKNSKHLLLLLFFFFFFFFLFFLAGTLTKISLINHSHLSQTFPKIKEREKGNGEREFLVNELHHFYYVSYKCGVGYSLFFLLVRFCQNQIFSKKQI